MSSVGNPGISTVQQPQLPTSQADPLHSAAAAALSPSVYNAGDTMMPPVKM